MNPTNSTFETMLGTISRSTINSGSRHFPSSFGLIGNPEKPHKNMNIHAWEMTRHAILISVLSSAVAFGMYLLHDPASEKVMPFKEMASGFVVYKKL